MIIMMIIDRTAFGVLFLSLSIIPGNVLPAMLTGLGHTCIFRRIGPIQPSLSC